jgi:hypothetical protein
MKAFGITVAEYLRSVLIIMSLIFAAPIVHIFSFPLCRESFHMPYRHFFDPTAAIIAQKNSS